MSVEGIKQLAQCEERAKERIKEAKEDLIQIKKQACKDAEDIVRTLEVGNQEKLKELQKQVEEYLELFERREKEEYERKIENLNMFKDEDSLIEEIVKRICERE